MILQGPYIQELTAYRPKMQMELLASILDNGATAIGFNLAPFSVVEVPPIQPKALRRRPTIWKVNDFTRLKRWALPTLDNLVETIETAGAKAVIYGPMFPDGRRQYAREREGLEPFIPAIKIAGVRTLWREWFTTWFPGQDPRVRDAWIDLWVPIVERYPDAIFVDGTEPYGGPLERPSNQFTDAIQAATPGVLRAGIDEIHVNPGESVPAGSEWLVFDGWGHSTRRYKVARGVRLRLAGLSGRGDNAGSQRAAEGAEAAYFGNALSQAHADGRPGLLYLLTTGWSAFDISSARNPDLQRPGYVSGSAPPFGRIQKRLTNVASSLVA
jgi:hypothetical protein